MFRNNWMLYKFRFAELHANIREMLLIQVGIDVKLRDVVRNTT